MPRTLAYPRFYAQFLLFSGTLFTVALLLITSCKAQVGESNFHRQVTVIGYGEMRAAPDMASLNAGVISLGDTAAKALKKNTAEMQTVFEALKKLGIADKDIQTSNFSVSPRYGQYGNSDVPPKIIGYQVSNSVTINLRDLTQLGAVLDSFVSAGANNLGGVQFSFSDPSALKNRARMAAIKDAEARAKLYAETAGASLGSVLIIQENAAPRPVPVMARMASFAKDSSVPIAAGEGTIAVNVTVTFALE